MKYLDEYRDGGVAAKIVAGDAPGSDTALGADGGLRRTDALDREERDRPPDSGGH